MAQERIDIVVTKTGDEAARKGVADIGDAADRTGGKVDALNSNLNFLKATLASLGVIEAVKQYTEMADTFTSIVNRLKLVTTSSQQLAQVEQQLLDSANRTRGSFEATAGLYSKLALNTGQLGIDQKQLIPTIETINQLIAISGTTAQEAQAGLLQFSQGLASNRFQGDELRSVLENLPALGQAIAKGLGTTTAGLRTMGEQGKLSAKLILDALEKQAPEVAKQFAALTPTVGGAIQVLKNNLLQFIGTFDQANGISSKFAQTLLFVGNNIALFIRSVEAAIAAVAAFYAGMAIQAGWNAFSAGLSAAIARLAAAQTALGYAGVQLSLFQKALILLQTPITAVRSAIQALWVAVATNPITAIIALLGAAAAAVYFFGDQVKLTADGSINLWGAVAGTVNYLWSLLKQLGTFVATLLGPTFRALGDLVVNVWTAIFNAVKRVIDYFAQFIPALNGLSAKLGGFGAEWVKAMQDASTSTKGLADTVTGPLGQGLSGAAGAAGALKQGVADLGGASIQTAGEINDMTNATVLWASAAADDTRAADAWRAAQERARRQMEQYTQSIKEQQAEVQRLALTTRNAMGEMVTVTDEWARRSGAAFNAVKSDAASTASSVSESMNQVVEAANSASSALGSYGSGGSSGGGGGGSFSSTFLNDKNTVKSVYENQGGTNWDKIGNALLIFDNLYGHPGGDTAALNLYNLLKSQPKEAARSFLQNYGYINAAFQGMGLPTFRTGGSFDVGGVGGTDSQLVQFMASPDERVTVQTPEQQRRQQEAPSVARPVTINMNVTTADANSFRRSKNQLYLQLRGRLAGATR